MIDLASIDAGKEWIGFAKWRGGLLIDAGALRSTVPDLDERAIALAHGIGCGSAKRVAVESMRFRKDDERSNPNDLLDVQTVSVGVAARVGGKVVFYFPHEWKASLPKGIHHRRLLGVLTPEEHEVASRGCRTAGKTHTKEVLDAIGIGLYDLKRTNLSGGPRR